MNNREFKLKFIECLKSRGVYFAQPSKIQFRTRCPFCGDSHKNLNTGHLYIRVNPDDNFPIVYNCFKCPAQGILTYDDMELLGIEGEDFKSGISTLNSTSDNYKNYTGDIEEIYFEYELPTTISNRWKVSYVEKRLGLTLSDDDIHDMRMITSLKDFLLLNNINKVTCDPKLAKLLNDRYIGFLSYNNSHILFRDCTDTSEISWFKYSITEESSHQKVFFSMKSEIDLFTDEDITINLSEGVMDCLSIYYNLGFSQMDNTINIAICGKYYTSMVKRMISTGFVGNNITINIFSDKDYTEDTSIDYYRKILKKYSYLVKEINVYYNLLYKDCGVDKSRIALEKFKI